MLKIKQVINSVFSSNSYLLYEMGYDYCWLVDIGDWERIKPLIPKRMSVRGVFLTHTHFDHIYGINNLFDDNPNLIVYTSEYGKDALYSEKKNFSFYHESPLIYKGKNVQILKEGDEIQLFDDERLVSIETPGHCPSCLTFFTNRYVFTGDSYIPGLKVVTKLPRGNKKLAECSLKRILELTNERDIFAGHGFLSS